MWWRIRLPRTKAPKHKPASRTNISPVAAVILLGLVVAAFSLRIPVLLVVAMILAFGLERSGKKNHSSK